MLIHNPLAYARGATTELAAARVLAAIEAEVSLGERPEGWYATADEALAHLHARWPRAHLRDAYREPPTLSPSARREPTELLPSREARLSAGAGRRSWHRPAAAAAILTMFGIAVWFVVRHARKRPRHVGAIAVIAATMVVGRPSLLAPLAVLAGVERMLGRQPTARRQGRRTSLPRIPLPRIGGVAPKAPRSPL